MNVRYWPQSGHPWLHRTRPLSGVKQTWPFAEFRFRARYWVLKRTWGLIEAPLPPRPIKQHLLGTDRLRVPQPHAGAAAVTADQLNARPRQRPLNDVECRPPRSGSSGFELANGHHPNPGLVSQLLLGPVQKTAGSPALCGGEHALE
jgi:hypothetical protein